MPIKKIPNQLNIHLVNQSEILNLLTRSKKSHFTITESKLCELLHDAIHTTGGFFNIYVSTYPYIAVHITGDTGKLDEYRDWLMEQVSNVLKDNHDIGIKKA